MVMTLVMAFAVRQPLLVIICMVVQCLAMIWY
jgi:hypothetical protein